MNRKVILMILDGRGLADEAQEHKSAIHLAKTPNFDKYWKIYPHSTLKTFGEHVGLPDGQMGNSEVGHMSIGSGRIIYQDLVKIGKMMSEGSFENIAVMQEIITQAKAENKSVHIVGLLSDGGVHSHIDHIKGMIDILDRNGIKSLVHAITDGRDVDPKSGIKYISDLLDFMIGKSAELVDVIGRYYAMDRDNRRERVKLATDLYTRGVGKCTNNILTEMQKNYNKGITDEFIKPIIYTPNFVQKDWNFDTLKTDRLIIKPVNMDDAEDIYNIGKDLEVNEYFDNPIHQTEIETREFISSWVDKFNKKEMISFAIRTKDGAIIGNAEIGRICTNKPVLGIWLGKDFWNQGFATETINAILKRINNNIEYDFIRRNCFADNVGSNKIIKQVGGKLITTFKNKNWKHGEINEFVYYIYNPNVEAGFITTETEENKSNNSDNIYNERSDESTYSQRRDKSSSLPEIISNGSIVIMTNFRTDRGREIVDALFQHDHIDNDIYKLDSLTMVTMTNYDDKFANIKVLLPRDNITETLGELISKADKKQIRIAETEKYPHVTFFFSGGQEAEFPGEKRILVNSPKVATYDIQPEMSAPEITSKIITEIQANWPDFVALNFANTDMVGHTGDLSAAIKAAETVDNCLGEIVNKALANDYDIIVIADHGNADTMLNDDQSPNTAHTVNLVPCIYISKDLSTVPFGTLKNGKLADIAPTILHLMGIDKPESMDGLSLL